MMDPINDQAPEDVKFEDVHLKKMFLEHLNSIYCGKQHLLHFFEEIKEMASLQQLKDAIQECWDATQSQLLQMDLIFDSIHEDQSKISVLGMKAMTLEAYISAIKGGKTAMERDVFIVFYVQLIEGIEVTYFKVLKNLAKAIGYSSTFLDKPFGLAIENKMVFEHIHRAYISEPA